MLARRKLIDVLLVQTSLGSAHPSHYRRATRQEVIRANAVKNVMFVSGDIHGSLTCSLTHSKDPDFVVHGIVSSPLCNTKLLPYAKASNLQLDTPLASNEQGLYSPALTSAMVSEDNFACLTLSGQSLQVDFYNPQGRVLKSVTIALK